MIPAWGLVAALLLGDPPAACLAVPAGGERLALLAAINLERLRAGRLPVRLDAVLCATAQERAGEMATRGSLDPTLESIGLVSRRLFARGYAAQSWSELPVERRGGPSAVLEAWRRRDPAAYRDGVLGDVQDLGIGVATLDGVPLYDFLLALPRHEAFRRETVALLDLAAVRGRILARVNAERARTGLAPLRPQATLDSVAQEYAEAMLQGGFYDHVDPRGGSMRTRLEAAGLHPHLAGENLAKGLFAPEEVVDRWLQSSGHRANLLEPRFGELGIGVAVGEHDGKDEVLWVQEFGAGLGN